MGLAEIGAQRQVEAELVELRALHDIKLAEADTLMTSIGLTSPEIAAELEATVGSPAAARARACGTTARSRPAIRG